MDLTYGTASDRIRQETDAMSIRYIRLIEDGQEDLWYREQDFSKFFGQAWVHHGTFEHGPADHLRYIKERRGEKIVAFDADLAAILGWIAVFPDRDVGGPIYGLSGIEVHEDHRGRGLGTGLMEAARLYIEERKVHRLKFGTSPLLTHCARLYVTRFGARYHWRRGVKGSRGRPWPCVSCECDFDDPLAKPADLGDDEIEERSVLAWDGMRPVPREVGYSGPLSVVLPELSVSGLAAAIEHIPKFIGTLHAAFDALFVHDYGFAWFDALPSHGAARFYYLMKRVMSI
jgi:GNAT superfamily N-acetyltransferase